MNIKVLDHGYVRWIEGWGHGDAGEQVSLDIEGPGVVAERTEDLECGIIEAARQSTQASFRGWDDQPCDCVGQIATMFNGCGKCEGKGVIRGDQRLLKYLYSHKPQHATPFEFAGAVIEVQGPIFVFREWHRHRTFSFNELSARYSPVPDTNYLPKTVRLFLNSKINKQAGTIKGAAELGPVEATDWLIRQTELYDLFEEHYQRGLQIGVSKEVARIGMPVGRYSRMRAQANLRNWLAFMTLRADPGAQWEIQEYARAVGQILEVKFPRTYKLWSERT